ncbi:hypothetical protein HDV03_004714 [Kappamyces sp. JEL0829]|nr:hypothetical protein HDV03_004714 [Kappamyces sp. JEL0829]
MIAAGASQNSNFFVLENTAKNQLTSLDSDRGIRSKFAMPVASHGLSSYGNLVVSCGSSSSAQLFKLNANDLALPGKGVEQIHECVFSSSHLRDMAISPPGKMIRTSRITRALLEPSGVENGTADTTVRRMVGLLGSSAIQYDIPTGRVVAQESAGSSAAVWSVHDAHAGSVTDVAFNTFIPYWLASAGEDGVVKMWDIRYMKGCAARIDAHYGAVTSLSWSNTHCEILSTASIDRTVRVWNIDSELSTSRAPWKEFMIGCPGSEFKSFDEAKIPEKVVIGATMIGNCTQFSSPVVSVVADPAHADTFLAATTLGIVSTHTVRSKVIEGLLKHRYDNAYEREVEAGIHSRHLNEALETMIKLSRNELAKVPDAAKHEGDLIKLCSTRPAIDPASWVVASRDHLDLQTVRADLKDFSYGLPPRFDQFPQWLTVVSDFAQIQFDLVLLRHQVTSEVNKGNWEIILEKEKSILSGMELDDEFMDIDTIRQIVETLLVNKYLKGMSIGLALGQLLADVPKFKFDSLADIMALLVFPTVFESPDWLPEKDLDLLKQNGKARQDYVTRYLAFLKEEKEREQTPVSIGLGHLGSRGKRFSKPPEKPMPKAVRMQSPGEESPDAKTSRKLVRNIMGDGKKALPMVSLELRLIKLIEFPPEDHNEEIIRIMQNVLTDSGVGGSRTKAGVIPFEKTISVFSNRLYLNALLETKRYEEYFGVSIYLISTFFPFEFAQSLLRQTDRDGFNGVKSYITSMLATANTTINSTLTTQGSGNQSQMLISGAKLLKDSVVAIVKIAAHLMDGLELLKTDRDSMEILAKMTTNLTGLMLQTSAALLRAFEHFDRITKSVCKEYAHTVHDALRDAARLMPLTSNKSRPVSVAEKAANGITIQEEAMSILEKLYKGYLKNEGSSQNLPEPGGIEAPASVSESTPLLDSVEDLAEVLYDFADDVGDTAVDLAHRTASLSFWSEFEEFSFGSKNLIEVAIGILIGNQFSLVLNSLMDDIFLPPLSFLSIGVSIKDYFWVLAPGLSNSTDYPTLERARADGAVTLNAGLFTQKLLEFLLDAFILFWCIQLFQFLRKRMFEKKKQDRPAEPPVPTKKCVWCLEEIHAEAKKCKFCTSMQLVADEKEQRLVQTAEFQEGGSPLLLPGERIAGKWKEVGIYQGNDKTIHNNGTLYLTTRRLLWTDGEQGFEYPLRSLRIVARQSGFTGFSSPKLQLEGRAVAASRQVEWSCDVCQHMNDELGKCKSCGVVSDRTLSCAACTFLNHSAMTTCEMCLAPLAGSNLADIPFKLSFRSSGINIGDIQSLFEQTMAAEGQADTSAKSPAATAPQPLYGVSGILKNLDEQNKRRDDTISANSFQDLESLMAKAAEMTRLVESLTVKLAHTKIEDGEPAFASEQQIFQKDLYDFGIVQPVTKETSGSKYHKDLAAELGLFLSQYSGRTGILQFALSDAFCLFNRARGVALVSPEDLYRASLQMGELPFCLRTFESGLQVLESRQLDDEGIVSRVRAVLEEHANGLSSARLAKLTSSSVLVAKEHLLVCCIAHSHLAGRAQGDGVQRRLN